jgi:CubicO group peptidase (beta-lactamase class C family)
VSVRQLLTMTSGVRWIEDYGDPTSDVARFNNHKPEDGVDALVSYLRKLPREAPPGTRWNYSTGETNLVGVLVSAGHEEAAGHLPLGEDLGAGGHGAAGDLAPEQDRPGDQRLLPAGGVARLRPLRPVHPRRRARRRPADRAGWLAGRSHDRRVGIGQPGRGYGYQWWTYDDGTFFATGIFGQGIFIDGKRKLVIVSNANWAGGARDAKAGAARDAFYRAVQQAVDAEGGVTQAAIR